MGKNGKKWGTKKTDENSGHYIITSSRPPERRPLERRTLVPIARTLIWGAGAMSKEDVMTGGVKWPTKGIHYLCICIAPKSSQCCKNPQFLMAPPPMQT